MPWTPSRPTVFLRVGFAFALLATALAVRPALAAPPSSPPGAGAAAGHGTPANTGELVVQLRAGANVSDLLAVLAARGAHVDRVIGHGGLVRITLPGGADPTGLLADLRSHPSVAKAGEDLVAHALNVPNDPGYSQQWDLQPGVGGIDVQDAWDLSSGRGSGVTVAIIDTGLAYEDYTGAPGFFGPKVFKRAPDLAGVPIVSPWNWIDGDSHANDDNGHGTHVAGTIAEATNNGAGEAGISAASLMPLKILDYAGNGVASDLIDAIYYAADHGAKVINLSLGFSGTGAPDANGDVCTEIVGLSDALDYADAMGVTVVAASGNDGATTVACPAAYPTVIAVGATRYDGSVTFYSNGGSALSVTAPGGDPNVDQNGDGVSDQITQQTYCLDAFSLLITGQYNQFCDMLYSGTSMASPHVAATAALLIGQLSTLSPAQVRDVLQTTARDRGAAGWDPESGWGEIDTNAALASIIANPPPPPPPGPPPKPRPVVNPGATNVVATTLSATSVRLTWTDSATNETGFRIDRSADGGTTWVQAGTAGANATSSTANGLAPATQYWFRVRSYDANGNSPWSAVVTATTAPPPAAPTNLVATPVGATKVTLTWTDNSTTEQGFRVERSTDGVNFSLSNYASANTTTISAGSLAASTTYWFRVSAYDGQINSAPSNVAQAMTLPLPAPPLNLTANTLNTTTVLLNWTDNSTTEQGFRVERSSDAGTSWSQAAVLSANTVTWTNYSLAPGTTYLYRVRGYDGQLNGDPSNVAQATTLPPPSAPANLTAATLDPSTVRLTWTDTSGYEQGFKLERSADGGNTWTQLATAGANATGYNASGLTPSTAYTFRVRAYDGTTNGEYSNLATAVTLDPPSPPTNIVAQAVNTTTVKLTWTNTSVIQTSVKVERSTDGVNWTAGVTLTSADTTWTNYSLTSATLYFYRLRAVAGSANGPYGDTVSATTFPPPPAPANLLATTVSATAVNLTWTDTSSYEQGFKLERSTDGGNTWTQFASPGANATAYSVGGLTPSTAYNFRVRAYDGATNGDYSNVATAVTLDPPSAPANVAAQAVNTTTVKLTWTNTSPIQTSVKIERSTDGVNWTSAVTMSSTDTTWTNYSLTTGTLYFYRLRAVAGSINGPNSAPVSVTTLPPPSAAANLTAAAVNSTSVKLTWTDTCSYESGFRVERSLDGSTWTQVASLPANSTTWTNSSLSTQTTYFYRVRAYEGSTNGDYTQVATVTTP